MRRQLDYVNYRVFPALDDLELLHASYTNQTFAKHTHDRYALGVIEQGALAFSYRGAKVVAPAGSINLAVPGEAHDGKAVTGQGWSYRMLYIQPALMLQAAQSLSDKPAKFPFFKAGTIKDDQMANHIRALHRLLVDPHTPLAEQQSQLLTFLTEFILRHAEEPPCPRFSAHEPQAVIRVKDYIEACYSESISLSTLARLCQLSPYYLIHAFRACLGIPPHAYLKQVRVRRAKQLLANGCSLAYAAQETGFTDQSHFTRQFKQLTGITPGTYSNIIQDGTRQ